MAESYPFPTYSGLLEPKHYKRIGSAIWLFLWCISSTTKEVERDGVTWGIVLGNKPVKITELAERFGVSEKTIRNWIEILEKHDYLRITRSSHGLIFTVKNSKKFKNRSEENYRSEKSDRKNITDQDGEIGKILPIRSEENYRSNKDIIQDINNNAADDYIEQDEIMKLAREVESYFLQKRGKGFAVSPSDFQEIKKMIADGVPLSIIKVSIDRCFAEYKPKHKHDEIRSITYCIPRCYDEWMKSQKTEPVTDAVPHVSVALGSLRKNKLQLANEKLIREIMEAEERERNGSPEIILDYPKLL